VKKMFYKEEANQNAVSAQVGRRQPDLEDTATKTGMGDLLLAKK